MEVKIGEKYYISDLGKQDYEENIIAYRNRTVKSKIMKMLKGGIGYRKDAIINHVKADRLVECKNSGEIVAELTTLVAKGFLKVGV